MSTDYPYERLEEITIGVGALALLVALAVLTYLTLGG